MSFYTEERGNKMLFGNSMGKELSSCGELIIMLSFKKQMLLLWVHYAMIKVIIEEENKSDKAPKITTAKYVKVKAIINASRP